MPPIPFMTPVEFGADVVVDISDHCMVSMMKMLIQQLNKKIPLLFFRRTESSERRALMRTMVFKWVVLSVWIADY